MLLRRGRPEQRGARGDVEKVRLYGELLLKNPDGSSRIAIHDVVTVKLGGNSNALATSRMSFYREGEEYRLDESHENTDEPITRHYLCPAEDDESGAWISGTEYMKWHRFSPDPTNDIRPFVKLLEQCFGKIPQGEFLRHMNQESAVSS